MMIPDGGLLFRATLYVKSLTWKHSAVHDGIRTRIDRIQSELRNNGYLLCDLKRFRFSDR